MINGIRFSPSRAISLVLALTVWMVFYPGTLSVDSLSTYHEAITRNFTDARPPFFAFVLFLFLKAGGTLGLFTLLGCLLGYLGVRRLLLAVTNLFGVERKRREIIASMGILILSSPLTPMPIYFVTLWFDTWLAIFLLWTIALLLELRRELVENASEMNWSKIFVVLILIVLVMLVRWNSVILYPALILAGFGAMRDRIVSRRILFALAISPLAVYILFLAAQYGILGVTRAYQERIVFALDLASMITHDPSICATLSLQSCDIVQGNITPQFIVGAGAIDHTLNQGLGTIEPTFVELALNPFLPNDLLQAGMGFPRTYGTVKLMNFLDYLRPQPRYYFQSFIHPNNLGLSLNSRFTFVRHRYVEILRLVYTHPVLKMFSFAHITWVILNLAGILYCLVFKQDSRRHIFLCLILIVPMLYVLSYLLALTASDFRFMYPSTLLVQAITIGLIATLPQQLSGHGQVTRNPSPGKY
jgi:hypothetical protein